MRIIRLYGHGQYGKSARLNKVKELLRAAGKSISKQPHPFSESPETFGYKGKVVCVAPAVDTREIVEANGRYWIFKEKEIIAATVLTRKRVAKGVGTLPSL